MDLSQYLPIINILGFTILGVSYIFVQWKLGGKGVSSEVIVTYKEQVGQLKEEIRALGLDVATMRGQMIEKDKKLQEFTTIFQGRDPELKVILIEIRDFMKVLTSQSKTNQARNESIDNDTSKEKGKVMTHEV